MRSPSRTLLIGSAIAVLALVGVAMTASAGHSIDEVRFLDAADGEDAQVEVDVSMSETEAGNSFDCSISWGDGDPVPGEDKAADDSLRFGSAADCGPPDATTLEFTATWTWENDDIPDDLEAEDVSVQVDVENTDAATNDVDTGSADGGVDQVPPEPFDAAGWTGSDWALLTDDGSRSLSDIRVDTGGSPHIQQIDGSLAINFTAVDGTTLTVSMVGEVDPADCAGIAPSADDKLEDGIGEITGQFSPLPDRTVGVDLGMDMANWNNDDEVCFKTLIQDEGGNEVFILSGTNLHFFPNDQPDPTFVGIGTADNPTQLSFENNLDSGDSHTADVNVGDEVGIRLESADGDGRDHFIRYTWKSSGSCSPSDLSSPSESNAKTAASSPESTDHALAVQDNVLCFRGVMDDGDGGIVETALFTVNVNADTPVAEFVHSNGGDGRVDYEGQDLPAFLKTQNTVTICPDTATEDCHIQIQNFPSDQDPTVSLYMGVWCTFYDQGDVAKAVPPEDDACDTEADDDQRQVRMPAGGDNVTSSDPWKLEWSMAEAETGAYRLYIEIDTGSEIRNLTISRVAVTQTGNDAFTNGVSFTDVGLEASTGVQEIQEDTEFQPFANYSGLPGVHTLTYRLTEGTDGTGCDETTDERFWEATRQATPSNDGIRDGVDLWPQLKADATNATFPTASPDDFTSDQFNPDTPPEGQYALSLCLSDAFDRPPAQQNVSSFGGDDGWTIVVDETRPTAQLEDPPEAIEPQRFSIKAEIQDTPVPDNTGESDDEYDALPFEDLNRRFRLLTEAGDPIKIDADVGSPQFEWPMKKLEPDDPETGDAGIVSFGGSLVIDESSDCPKDRCLVVDTNGLDTDGGVEFTPIEDIDDVQPWVKVTDPAKNTNLNPALGQAIPLVEFDPHFEHTGNNKELVTSLPCGGDGEPVCNAKDDRTPSEDGSYVHFNHTLRLVNPAQAEDEVEIRWFNVGGSQWPIEIDAAGETFTESPATVNISAAPSSSTDQTLPVEVRIQPPDDAEGEDFAEWRFETESEASTQTNVFNTFDVRAELKQNLEFDSEITLEGVEGFDANITIEPGNNTTGEFHIENDGNAPATYTLDYGEDSTLTGDDCDRLQDNDEDDQVLLRLLESGTERTQVSLETGEEKTLTLEVEAERLAPPDRTLDCRIHVENTETGTSTETRDHDIEIDVLRDSALEMYERQDPAEPEDGQTKEIERTGRPGEVVSTQITYENKGNDALDLRLRLRPQIASWDWSNREDARTFTVASFDGSDQEASQITDRCDGNEEACYVPFKMTLPEDAVRGESATFTLTAINQATNTALNSVDIKIEVDDPGEVDIHQPSTQVIAEPSSGSTTTSFGFSASPAIPFKGETTGQLRIVSGCTQTPTLDDIEATTEADDRATFNFDLSFTKPSSWKIEVPDADTEGDGSQSVACTLPDGADRGIVYLRPGVSTTTERVDFFGERVFALALGYDRVSDLGEAELEDPSDQVYLAEQGDPIEFSLSGSLFDTNAPDDRAGFLVHEGQSEDGFHHIGCLSQESCDLVQEYKSVAVLDRPVNGGVPISSEEFSADQVHTPENEADSDVPDVDGFVDEVRLGDGSLDAGHEPIVFHVVGDNGQEADDETEVDVEVKIFDNFGETHELPTVEARNLGGGWFEADLVLPVVQFVTRAEIQLDVSGDSVAGNGLSGDAKIRFGARNFDYQLAPADQSDHVIFERTDDGETTWYLDVNRDGQIDELDWELAASDGDGGDQPSDLISQADPSSENWAVGVVRDQPEDDVDAYYLHCTSCDEEIRIRLTPYGDQASGTWTLVEDADADAGVSLNTAEAGLVGAVVGAQGPQLYAEDTGENHLVRLTQGENDFDEFSIVDGTSDPPVAEFWTPPELSDLDPSVIEATIIPPSDTYAQDLLDGDQLHLAFASPSGAIGEGITPIRIGALTVSTTDLEGTNSLSYSTVSDLQVEPHIPDRSPRATGHQSLTLSQEGSSPWMVGETSFDAQAALERTWEITVPTDTDDIDHEFSVARTLDSPQQDTRLPAFVALTEDDTLQGTTFDHRAVPGFDLHASNVTFDLVAVDGSAAELQRRTDTTNIQVVDPNPPDVSIDAPDAVEQDLPTEITVTATDPSGIDEVTAAWSLDGESGETEIELSRVKASNRWNGTFTPSEQGDVTLEATATDTGGNLANVTQSITVLADEEPRIRFQGPVNAGTAFVTPGGQAAFEVEDATIGEGEVTVSQPSGDSPSENMSTLTGADGQLELEGLGDTLSTGSYTVTVTATNNTSEPLQDGLVWLNASASGVTSTIDANETDADGKVTGRVDLDATGTLTLTLEANNASLDEALSASFDVEVFDPDASGDSVSATIDCGTTTCDVTFDPGVASHGDTASFQIQATDGTGSTNTSVFDIQADGQPPTAEINVEPGSGSDPITAGGDSEITVDARDPSGIDDIQLEATQGGRTLADVSVLNESGEITIGNMGIQDGEATLTATVRDRLGQQTTESVDVSVDGSGPDIGDLSLTATQAGCEAQVPISDPSGVAEVRLSYNGGSGSVETGMASGQNGYATVLQQLRSDMDTVSYTVEATDELGNTASQDGSVSASPCVEGAVGVSITSPGDGDTVSGEIDLDVQLDGPAGGTVTVNAITIEHADGTTDVGPDLVGTGFEVPTEETTTIDTRALPNGQATITVEAGTAETTVSDSIDITIDNAEDTGCAETVDLDETDQVTLDGLGDGLLCVQADTAEGATHVRILVTGEGQEIVNETRKVSQDGVYKLPTMAEGDYQISVTQIEETEDGQQRELTTASAGVSLTPPKPFGRFLSTLILGAAVIGTTAYAAFGRWS